MHSHKNSPQGMAIALAITFIIMLLEFFGGLVTNSLALLSDAGHMLSDVSSLLFSLLAFWAAKKPATASKPFGYHRFEILAALLNGLTLLLISLSILYESYHRLLNPQPVQSDTMMLIAAIGLVANLISAWALKNGSNVSDNINARSAYLHVIGDALSSVGVIVAGFLMMNFSLFAADPIISGIVALVIGRGAFNVLRESTHILMEGAPAAVDTRELTASLCAIEGVQSVHSLRLWTLTSGLYAFCCHLTTTADAAEQTILTAASQALRERIALDYVAIQIERPQTACPTAPPATIQHLIS